MRNGFKTVILGFVLICILTMFYSLSFANEEEDNTLRFEGYQKIGDTVKVVNASSDNQFIWSVYDPSIDDIVYEETNTTGEFKVYEKYNEMYIDCFLRNEDMYLSMYVSKLPVMYMDSVTDYYNVSKDSYNDVSINLTGNSKYTNSDYLYNGSGEIKIRGNSTADREKKPFRLKLNKSANLLNLGLDDNGKVYKSKHWVLLANDMDHTLMRNKLLYDLSGDIGFEYYFNSTSVVLIYNGEYMGVYQLCEHRRVDEGRINITDWVSLGEDIAEEIANEEWKKYNYASASDMEEELNEIMYSDYSWIDNSYVMLNGNKFDFKDYGFKLPKTNGGYLAELDFLSMGSSEIANIDTAYGLPFYINTPEVGEDSDDIEEAVTSFKNTSLYKNAKSYIQTFEYALHSKNFIFNSGTHYAAGAALAFSNGSGWRSQLIPVNYVDTKNDGKHYSELFDLNSLVNYFLFNEFADNYDAMKTSAFFYKEVDELAKMGPMWDFDLSLGNINSWIPYMWYPARWHTTNNIITNAYPFQSFNWFRLLIKDPYFLVKVYERYKEIRPIIENIVKDGGLVDQYYDYLKEAALANDERWGYTYTPENYGGGIPLFFEDSMDKLNEFLDVRVEWLDRQFKSIDTLINSIGYYKETTDLEYEYNGNYLNIKSLNINCNNIEVQVNGKALIKSNLDKGEAMINIPKTYLYSGDKYNVIVIYEKKGDQYILNKSFKPSNNYEYIPRSKYFYFKSGDKFVNTNELNVEIESILEENMYTPESWETFKAVYYNAKNIVSNKKSMQEDIDKCLSELKAAKLNLVAVSDTIKTPSDDIVIDIPIIDDEEDDNIIIDDENNVVIDNKPENDKSIYDIILIICGVGIIIGVVMLILNNRKKTSV